MFTLTDVMIDALWILGLSGVFATLSYIDYYRSLSKPKTGWRQMWQRPVLLMPLSLSLMVFCIGLALNGATSFQPDPLWQTAIWNVMSLLFAAQMVLYWRAGRTQGWNTPVDGEKPVGETPTDDDRSAAERGLVDRDAAADVTSDEIISKGGSDGQ